jgi:formylglycine-generating enzyme
MPKRRKQCLFTFLSACPRTAAIPTPRLAWAAALIAVICVSAYGVSVAHAVQIDWITVGNPGNSPDPATGSEFGNVADVFRMMRLEWTNSQYVTFLNAIDPVGLNPNGVYNANMGSDPRGGIVNTGGTYRGRYEAKANMGDKPVNFVSWFDAARVANWLNGGGQAFDSSDASANAPQNTGAYTLGTATTGTAPNKNPDALCWIPTESEWYKTAYYNPTLNANAGGYRLYGNGFDEVPTSVASNEFGIGSAGSEGNFANLSLGAAWNAQVGNVTTVGTNGSPSFYGAFDMSGNLWEWNDLNTNADGLLRGLRGSAFDNSDSNASSLRSEAYAPWSEGRDYGFRLVAVPEPSLLGVAAGGLFLASRVVRHRRRAA